MQDNYSIREAAMEHIQQMQLVRNAVKENVLSDPGLVTDKDCEEYITQRGKGWVCCFDEQVVGFSIVDLKQNNVWALFVHPNFDKQGIGTRLHHTMIDWYFSKTDEDIWLGTDPHTHAASFYRKYGWKEVGVHGRNEIKFLMTKKEWQKNKLHRQQIL